jgi:hypothetical protein
MIRMGIDVPRRFKPEFFRFLQPFIGTLHGKFQEAAGVITLAPWL